MLDNLRYEARRQQQGTAQLTWLVSAVAGNKTELASWYTGYARDLDTIKTGLPPHLEADLFEGTSKKLLSQVAYEALRRVEKSA